VPVHTLEIDAALCAEGAALANRQRLSHEFLNINALTAADWPKRGQHAVALHACGDLHRRLIAQGADVGVARFDVAPCCYYRGVASTYQALSGNLHTALTRDDVRLAVTETVTASARLTVQRDKEMAWKLGFDAYRRASSGRQYQNFKPVGDGTARSCVYLSCATPSAVLWRSGWRLIWRFFLKTGVCRGTGQFLRAPTDAAQPAYFSAARLAR
jgi:hypothetical protein